MNIIAQVRLSLESFNEETGQHFQEQPQVKATLAPLSGFLLAVKKYRETHRVFPGVKGFREAVIAVRKADLKWQNEYPHIV